MCTEAKTVKPGKKWQSKCILSKFAVAIVVVFGVNRSRMKARDFEDLQSEIQT